MTNDTGSERSPHSVLCLPQGIPVELVPDLELLENSELPNGLIDVTAAPFNADPRGEIDSTSAIQEAVISGREHKHAVYFPAGTYLVSDTIACVAGWTEERTPLRRYLPHCEYWPCVLLGARGGDRPRIVLAEHSPGFADPEHPKPILDFYSRNWARPKHGQAPPPGRQGNVNFHQTLLGVDIDVGPRNPGAACVSFDAAEGSSLQDCRFAIIEGHAGVLRGPGCGAVLANLEFFGGDVGLIADSGRPPATTVGCRFGGQRLSAVRKSHRANLTLAGCSFDLPRGVHAVRSYPVASAASRSPTAGSPTSQGRRR